jgi:hypothetical protein
MKKFLLCFAAVFALCFVGLAPKAEARVFVNIGLPLPVPFFGYPAYYGPGPGVVYYGGGPGYYRRGYYCGPRRLYYRRAWAYRRGCGGPYWR